MATAAAVMAEAKTHLGYTETGTNHSMFGKWYGMDGAAWCAMFVSYCMNKAGAGALIKGAQTAKGSAQVSGFVRHAKKHKWAKIAPAKSLPGDIVIFDFPGGYETDHVGFIRAAAKGSNIYTIEGNTSSGKGSQSNGGGVYARTRSFGVVHSIWRPPYDAAVAAAPAAAVVVPENVAPVVETVAVAPAEKPQAAFVAIKIGAKGDKVKTIQSRVGATADGVFGPKTEQAVKNWQTKKGIAATGIVNEETWNRLTK
jgi:hypothetical protein